MNDTQLPLIPVARIHGEPMMALPMDLYIPPDALELVLEAFQGPLDLLLRTIRDRPRIFINPARSGRVS